MKIAKQALMALTIMAIMILAGCGSSPSPSPRTSSDPASGPNELDLAIRDASDYLNDNIPAGSMIVILNVQSDSAALSDYIIDELLGNAVNDRLFKVVDRQQLDLIRTEQNFQLSGEVDDKLALSIGKFFGAQTIVSGKISQVGDRYRITIRALEVQTAQVQGQYNRNIAAGATITALMGGNGAPAGGTQSAPGGTTGSGGTAQAATATPATPANTAPASSSITGTMVPGNNIQEKLDWLATVNFQEKRDWLVAVASQKSEESAEILSKVLMDLNSKRMSRNIRQEDEQLVRLVIPLLGEIGHPSARTALNAVSASNWTPPVVALANNALKKIK